MRDRGNLFNAVLERDNYKCNFCHEPVKYKPRRPTSACLYVIDRNDITKKNTLENFLLCCKTCLISKKFEYLQYNPKKSKRNKSNARIGNSKLLAKLIVRDGFECYYCKCPVSIKEPDERRQHDSATIDHKQPLSKGGSNKQENLALCCYACNHKKGNQTEDEYKESTYLKNRYRQFVKLTDEELREFKHFEIWNKPEITRTRLRLSRNRTSVHLAGLDRYGLEQDHIIHFSKLIDVYFRSNNLIDANLGLYGEFFKIKDKDDYCIVLGFGRQCKRICSIIKNNDTIQVGKLKHYDSYLDNLLKTNQKKSEI